MSSWICCNSCFLSPSDERKLAVTTCGHIICNDCYNKGKQGICLICSARCHFSPLSDKSSSEVKALFSDVGLAAAKHCREISKVLTFQAGHRNRLCTHYQQKCEKQKDTFVQMKQEMQHMSKKLNEQSAYITKLENSLHCHSASPSSVTQVTHRSHIPYGRQSDLQMATSSPLPISRHSSMSNVNGPNVPASPTAGEFFRRAEIMDVSGMSLFRKPGAVPRGPLFSAGQAGQMGSDPPRLSSQDLLASRSALSASTSTFPGSAEASYSQASRWQTPVFKAPSSLRNWTSSLF